MMNIPTAPHLHDSELLHLVDADASAFELDLWSKHVLACGECCQRLEVLQRRTAKLSALLSDIQLPEGFAYPTLPKTSAARQLPLVRRSDPWMHWMRAALVVLALGMPLVFVQPLRAWVADQFSLGWTQLTALIAGEEAGGGAPVAAPASSARIWFEPVGPDLVVDIVSTQRTGQLVLRTADDKEGSLEIVGGTDETTVVTEGRLQIINEPSSSASYRVGIPASVQRTRIQLAGETVAVLSPKEIRDGNRVSLGARMRR